MKLDTSGWKAFNIGDIFVIHNGKGITKEEIENNPGDLIAVQSGEDNNGCIGRINRQYCIDNDYAVFNTPCLTVARSGSAGFVSYQKNGCVVGDSAKILELKNCDTPSDEVFLFLQAILLQIRAKYTYGRKVTQDKYAAEIIKLPATPDGTPDWDFMESYMKTLHYKPLTTKNKPGNAPELETERWGKFNVGKLFEVTGSKTTSKDDLDCIGKGIFPYVTTSAQNNGIEGYYDYWTEVGNVITVESACMGYATYQPVNFSASDHVELLRPKFLLNKYIALFIVGIINAENYKYSYGRKCNQIRIRNMEITLPATPDGTPDWQFMEDYIKALPYGDRL